MVGTLIPNLILAHSAGHESEPTKFDDYVIPKNFTSLFRFRDGEKTWSAYFKVTISDLGTPKLLSVEVKGSKAKHPKPGTKTFTDENRHELAEIEITKGLYWATKEEQDEYDRLDPEPESVERWQLKVIEMYRFQLLEMGIHLAIQLGKPTQVKSPDGALHRVYLPREPLTEAQTKQLQREIGKKIRQKVTPDLLAHVAQIYTEAGLRGEKPIKAIAEFYKCSDRTAQDYATKARKHKKKFLPETTSGKVTVKKPRARKEKK